MRGKSKDKGINAILNQSKNLFGNQLSIRCRELIKDFLNNPTAESWDRICGIVIWDAPLTNIWTALTIHDPSFEVVGRNYEFRTEPTKLERCDLVYEWKQIPTPFEVLRALRRFHEDFDNSPKNSTAKVLELKFN